MRSMKATIWGMLSVTLMYTAGGRTWTNEQRPDKYTLMFQSNHHHHKKKKKLIYPQCLHVPLKLFLMHSCKDGGRDVLLQKKLNQKKKKKKFYMS